MFPVTRVRWLGNWPGLDNIDGGAFSVCFTKSCLITSVVLSWDNLGRELLLTGHNNVYRFWDCGSVERMFFNTSFLYFS